MTSVASGRHQLQICLGMLQACIDELQLAVRQQWTSNRHAPRYCVVIDATVMLSLWRCCEGSPYCSLLLHVLRHGSWVQQSHVLMSAVDSLRLPRSRSRYSAAMRRSA